MSSKCDRTDIKLLADMNISPQTVAALQGEGWDIIRVSDVLPATTSDLEILEFARREVYTKLLMLAIASLTKFASSEPAILESSSG
ncbi:MAG: DUF5615 family PIN-like protein [Nostoc sp.]|uniref:DUF5615 family PIN-like protein n=1 Tax=Nostoc sp. TaxID=1180 RepID=UPI002FFA0F9A